MTRGKIEKLYLDYVNNFYSSLGAFADHHSLTFVDAFELIEKGRKIRAANKRQR